MKADTFDFPLLLAAIKDWPPVTPPTLCYVPTVSQGPASPPVLPGFLTCAFAIGCSKQFPFYKSLFLACGLSFSTSSHCFSQSTC